MAIEKITLETRLAELFLASFSDWEIYPEVTIQSVRNEGKSGAGSGGSIDIFMKKGVLTQAVECKLKTNFAVLGQAKRNKAFANYSYICVPKPKTFFDPFFLEVCKAYGIGIFTVSENDQMVRQELPARFNRKTVKIVLEEWMKQSVAGTLHGRMTQFKYTIERITQALQRNKGRMNIANLFSKTTYHWGSASSAKQCILNYIRKGIITEFRIEGAYLILNTQLLQDQIVHAMPLENPVTEIVSELNSLTQSRDTILKSLLKK